MNLPSTFPILVAKKAHGIQAQCLVCHGPFRLVSTVSLAKQVTSQTYSLPELTLENTE